HRVKNNLQIVDSLLVMQRARLNDPEARAALSGLRSRVFALGLVHHQLMGSGDLQTFEIAPFLEELSRNLLKGSARKGVVMSVHAPPFAVGLDFAIPLGLIVTEVVTNAIKYAFPSGEGRIDVRLERVAGKMMMLTMADDGVGAEADLLVPRKGSLGMTIVGALVTQLGGRFRTWRDSGLHVEVQVPEPVRS
ncbi:MAG: sensor histidine kinase, partial [Microvirga sp.]